MFYGVAPQFDPHKISEVSHSRVIYIFHKIVKRYIIPQIETKQYALANLRGIVNSLCALEDNGSKNNHPLRVPLPSTKPVKFYIQDSKKYLPDFPGRCVIVLVWHTNNLFPPHLKLPAFRDSSIQVVYWILVHQILVDTI